MALHREASSQLLALRPAFCAPGGARSRHARIAHAVRGAPLGSHSRSPARRGLSPPGAAARPLHRGLLGARGAARDRGRWRVSRRQRRADARRDAVLARAGYRVVRLDARWSFETSRRRVSRVAGSTRSVSRGPQKRKPGFGCRVFICLFVSYRRGGQIRTADLSDPNRARYQTALRPERRRRTMVRGVRSVKDETTGAGDFCSARRQGRRGGLASF